MAESKPKTYAEYARRFPKDVQRILQQIREAIHTAAPQAEETISYDMPAFRMDGILVWFGAHARHIGFYPGASVIAAFKKELARYKHAKGSVQFPMDEPLPIALITRMVRLRVKETTARLPPLGASQRPSKRLGP